MLCDHKCTLNGINMFKFTLLPHRAFLTVQSDLCSSFECFLSALNGTHYYILFDIHKAVLFFSYFAGSSIRL